MGRLVAGVGINDMPRGWANKNKLNRSIYMRWCMMLHRLYNIDNPDYGYYGARGYYCSKDFLRLSGYVFALQKNSLWDDFCKEPDKYEVDKDLTQSGASVKVYSPETIRIVLQEENRSDRNRRNPNNKRVRAVNIKTGQEVIYRTPRAVVKDGFDPSSVIRVCNGSYKQHKGWKFEYME